MLVEEDASAMAELLVRLGAQVLELATSLPCPQWRRVLAQGLAVNAARGRQTGRQQYHGAVPGGKRACAFDPRRRRAPPTRPGAARSQMLLLPVVTVVAASCDGPCCWL